MRLTVVIPAFDAPLDSLRRAVNSARSCSGVHEILVIDDGSGTPVDASDLASPSMAAPRVLRQPNAGPAAARNRGIEAADPASDALLFLDADDELMAAGVAALVSLVQRLEAVAGIAAKVHVPAGTLRPVPPEWVDRALPHPGDVFRPIALFSTSGVLATRRALAPPPPLTPARFDPTLRHGEDRVFLRAIAAVGPIAVSAEPAVRFTIHPPGAANLSSARHFATRIRDHLAVMDRHLDPATEPHFRDATRWLVNAAAKAGVDHDSWRLLAHAAADRGWPVPLKCRLRRLIRRPKVGAAR